MEFLAFVVNVKAKDGYSNAFEIQLCFKRMWKVKL